MSSRLRPFSTSVGTKLLIGLTGLFLVLYLAIHIIGNVLVFFGPRVFNTYAYNMEVRNPTLPLLELAILVGFVVHIYKTVRMWIGNQAARPVAYQKKAWAGHTSRKSLSSSTMIYSGLTIFLFVLVHLKQFKFGTMYQIGDPAIRDLYRTEIEVFSQPGWVVVYVVCVGLVAMHLRHGIASAFQSIGADHPVYTRRIVLAGTIIAVLIGLGFAVIPLWVLLTR